MKLRKADIISLGVKLNALVDSPRNVEQVRITRREARVVWCLCNQQQCKDALEVCFKGSSRRTTVIPITAHARRKGIDALRKLYVTLDTM